MIEKQPGVSATLRFEPALPCTSQDCPNTATVGNASYDPKQNAWVLFPLCKECIATLVRAYGDEEQQATN